MQLMCATRMRMSRHTPCMDERLGPCSRAHEFWECTRLARANASVSPSAAIKRGPSGLTAYAARNIRAMEEYTGEPACQPQGARASHSLTESPHLAHLRNVTPEWPGTCANGNDMRRHVGGASMGYLYRLFLLCRLLINGGERDPQITARCLSMG
jgi:hypothetical protein